jgi:midasin (ATPase involved in ribosome maturation)
MHRVCSPPNPLSFSDDRIVSSITSLGISLGSEVDKGLDNIKSLEQNRLLEASKTELDKDNHESSDEDDASEADCDLDLNQHAIQHLVGDIADDIFGEQDSQNLDFKSTPRSKKLNTKKNKKGSHMVSSQSNRSQ